MTMTIYSAQSTNMMQQNTNQEIAKPSIKLRTFIEYPKSELTKSDLLDFIKDTSSKVLKKEILKALALAHISAVQLSEMVEEANLPGVEGARMENICAQLVQNEEMYQNTQFLAQELFNAQSAVQVAVEQVQSNEERGARALQQKDEEIAQLQRTITAMSAEISQTTEKCSVLENQAQQVIARKAEKAAQKAREKAEQAAHRTKQWNQFKGSMKVIGITAGGAAGLACMGGTFAILPYVTLPTAASSGILAGGTVGGVGIFSECVSTARKNAREIGDQLRGIDINSAEYKAARAKEEQDAWERDVNSTLAQSSSTDRISAEQCLVDAREREKNKRIQEREMKKRITGWR